MTEQSDSTAQAAPKTPKKALRRRQAIATVLLIVAAATFWAASRMVWATLTVTDDLSPIRAMDVHGSDWSPWLTPLALVLLAAIAAAAAFRGWVLRMVAALIAVAGVLAALPAVSLLVGGDQDTYAARAIDLSRRYRLILVSVNDWAGIVVLLGTILTVAGAVVLLRVANGERMSSKYESPAARRAEVERKAFRDRRDQERATDGEAQGAPESERLLWDAIDTGADPTDDDRR